MLRLSFFGCIVILAESNNRPTWTDRTYHSRVIDNLISTIAPLILDPSIALLFTNCLPNTLDTTVQHHTWSRNESDTFIITGDIAALWLRDSSNQIIPYLPYVTQDSELNRLAQGLISRHSQSILIDSFANAFNFNASGSGHQDDIRTPPMTPSVFEGKYEIDSISSFMKLSYW